MQPDSNKCFVSIWTPPEWQDKELYKHSPKMEGWKDSIQLVFNDVTNQDKPSYVLFNDDMARKLVAFVYKNMCSDFVVHCDAGMSRSVAVGCYLRDQLGYLLDLQAWYTDIHRNQLVYRILMGYR